MLSAIAAQDPSSQPNNGTIESEAESRPTSGDAPSFERNILHTTYSNSQLSASCTITTIPAMQTQPLVSQLSLRQSSFPSQHHPIDYFHSIAHHPSQMSVIQQQWSLPCPVTAPNATPANTSLSLRHDYYIPPSQGSMCVQDSSWHCCPVCLKRFSRPSALRIHIYSHTGEKPFTCPFPGCGTAFSVRSNMRRHERSLHSSGVRTNMKNYLDDQGLCYATQLDYCGSAKIRF